ncbi:hypothetical protein GWK47_035534 [Chionoecetes opilio]|uniref:SH3 domain-containing protein n=1 Tax=Chionoecetes opilio TaxID=41210 RepID=A0A8J4YQ76_CHIOP|nr:hypothetical protein GWK47_035534 [Chionoecetes opilio]
MGDVVYVYTARQGCWGNGGSEPGMEAKDVIHVSAEYLQMQKMTPDCPNGWLLGTNMRTRQEGYFPGYFLVLSGTRRRSTAPAPAPAPPESKAPPSDTSVGAAPATRAGGGGGWYLSTRARLHRGPGHDVCNNKQWWALRCARWCGCSLHTHTAGPVRSALYAQRSQKVAI